MKADLVILALAAVALMLVASSCGGASVETAAAGSRSPWQRVFRDDFSHGLDGSRWGAYSGQPGGDPGGWWAPSHATVRGGMLNLESYRDSRYGGRWTSGGVSSAMGLKQRYGRYLVRFRMDGGRGIAGVLLLWPSDGDWPPEIDFAEDGGITRRRRSITATLHYGSDNRQIQRTVRADFTKWHTAGVEWSPRKLVYTLDGRPWATVRSAHVPSRRMELDMQTQAGTCGDQYAPCPDAGTPAHVNMQVDWVAAYRYRPPARR